MWWEWCLSRVPCPAHFSHGFGPFIAASESSLGYNPKDAWRQAIAPIRVLKSHLLQRHQTRFDIQHRIEAYRAMLKQQKKSQCKCTIIQKSSPDLQSVYGCQTAKAEILSRNGVRTGSCLGPAEGKCSKTKTRKIISPLGTEYLNATKFKSQLRMCRLTKAAPAWRIRRCASGGARTNTTSVQRQQQLNEAAVLSGVSFSIQ